MSDSSKRGPKLSDAAKRLIRERIVAGDDNAQIGAALSAAGFPADLHRNTYAAYRNDPDVVAAVAELDMESLQSGLALRARRIGLYSHVLGELARRMEVLPGRDRKGVPIDDLLLYVDKSFEVSRFLDDLIAAVEAARANKPIPQPRATATLHLSGFEQLVALAEKALDTISREAA